eukprot:4579125-Pleurochrysis_carterae.AAC.1
MTSTPVGTTAAVGPHRTAEIRCSMLDGTRRPAVVQLRDDGLGSVVPRVPERVPMRLAQRRARDRAEVVPRHHTLREQKIAKQGCEEHILTKQTPEELARQRRPGDRVGDGGEDPIELA